MADEKNVRDRCDSARAWPDCDDRHRFLSFRCGLRL